MLLYMLFSIFFKHSRENQHKICHISPNVVLFATSHPSCSIHMGVVYCYGVAILLRAESGGEVIA